MYMRGPHVHLLRARGRCARAKIKENPLFSLGSLLGIGKSDKSLNDSFRDIKDVTVRYAKQETIAPLKQLGRYLAKGVSGAVLMAVGLIFLTLALLRALQTETGEHFTGHLTWVPYVVSLAVFSTVIAIAIGALMSGRRRSQADKGRDGKGGAS